MENSQLIESEVLELRKFSLQMAKSNMMSEAMAVDRAADVSVDALIKDAETIYKWLTKTVNG